METFDNAHTVQESQALSETLRSDDSVSNPDSDLQQESMSKSPEKVFFKVDLESKDPVIESSDSGVSDATSRNEVRPQGIFPGKVRFNGCLANQLNDFAVMREGGGLLIRPPVNGLWYSTEGFWYRPHLPKNEWYKIPDTCEVEVSCSQTGISLSGYCVLGAISSPRWTADPPVNPNPFK